MLQVKEFDRSTDVSELTLVDSVVFVIWQWEGKEAADDLNASDSDDEITVIPETPLDESSDDETMKSRNLCRQLHQYWDIPCCHPNCHI